MASLHYEPEKMSNQNLDFHITDMQDARFMFVAAPEEAPLPTDLQNIQISSAGVVDVPVNHLY